MTIELSRFERGLEPVGTTHEQPPLGWYRYGVVAERLKRLIDVVVSAMLLVVLAPVLITIGVAVRRTSPGPALFRQTRVGFGEQPFTIYKFRTMAADNDASIHREFVTAMLNGSIAVDGGVEGHGDDEPVGEDADSGGSMQFKLDDPRVTPFGAWLRRTSLDELPQLYNVLRGEMSLVGPRPSLFYEVEEYEPRHRLRALSMPGMTGLWQVEGRSQLHMKEALDLDATYIETCSLGEDLKILARTVTVFSRQDAA